MLKRLAPTARLIFAVAAGLVAARAATPEQIRQHVGIYIWGRVPDFSLAIDDAANGLGADRVVRTFVGPWSDTPPYEDDTRPLAIKLNDPPYQKLIAKFEVIMLTAYDSYSYEAEYGEADTPAELQDRFRFMNASGRPNRGKIENPSLGVVKHLAQMPSKGRLEYLRRVRQEFSDFAFVLAHYDRTFILSNWEAENDVPETAYWPWFQEYLQARLDGIAEGRARASRQKLPGRILTAFEFTIVPGFSGRHSGLEWLGSALRGLDFVSYSAWWSIGANYDVETMSASLREALRRIKGSAGGSAGAGQRVIIGEFGEYWNDHADSNRMRAIVDTSIDEGVDYLFNWTLYDQPGERDDHGRDASHFGKFTQERKITSQGSAMRKWFRGTGSEP